MGVMKYRVLGRTGLSVSEIGFGARPIGGNAQGDSYGPTEDRWSKVALAKAFGYGCNFIDTADVYGHGHSEELIGRITNCRNDVLVASKAGYNFYAGAVHPDFTPAYIRLACLESLRRLRKEAIDLYQLHNPPLELIQDGGIFDVLDELKREGRIRFYGVAVDDPAAGMAAVRNGRPDAIQVTLNMLRLDEERERLLELAVQRNMGVIACEPLANGLLTGKFDGSESFSRGDFRAGWSREYLQEQAARVDALKFLIRPDRTLAQAALHFVLAQPGVSTVVVGCKTPQHTDENFSATLAPPLTEEELERVRRVAGRKA
jgi:aryl-alcohol dehydrogenase-like predicted oxidoreductase